MTKYLPAAIGLLLLTSPALAFDSEDRIDVTAGFAEGEDVSGVACSDPVGTWPRNCVVVVDEGIAVQRSTITTGEDGYHLAAGDQLALFGFDDEEINEPFVGTAPQLSCPAGFKKASEHDSEGITFVAGFYFVAGSHGCGRNNDAARQSAFLVARFRPDARPAETLTPAGDVTFRLNEVLTTDPVLAEHFSKDLDTGGISIEGVAGLGDPARLYFGLRSPTGAGGAYIVSVDAAALFTSGADLQAQPAKLVDLQQAGDEMGIRDLAVIDDAAGRLMILVGPEKGDGGPFFVVDYDVATGEQGPMTELRTPEGKAEGLLLLDRAGTKAKVLILHDDAADGVPAIEIVPLH